MATNPPRNNSNITVLRSIDDGDADSFERLLTPHDYLSVEHRRIRRQIVEVCFATGQMIDRDVLTIILAAKAGREESFEHWNATVVREMLWVDIVEWCLFHEVDVPGDVPETLWALFGCLNLSDSVIAALREPLTLEAGLDRHGRRKPTKRRHPSRKRVS